MADATEFLSEQLGAYADAWKVGHQQAIECWELEKRIEIGMAFYHYIESLDERWGDAVRAGKAVVDDAESMSIGALYSRWLVPAQSILASVKMLESQGYTVSGSQAFHDASLWARAATTLDAAEIQAAYAELDAGGGRPLEEVVDEIRRRHVSKSV